MGNSQAPLTAHEQKELVAAANFSERDIKKIYKRFRALDTNQNGELDPHELFDVPEISDNPLVKRVISIFDINQDGKVSFVEFLVGLGRRMTNANGGRVLTRQPPTRSPHERTETGGGPALVIVVAAKLAAGVDEKEKMRFVFDIYDIDKDGHISNGELFGVMKMMVGNNLNDHQLQQLVDRTILQADKDGDGMISFYEFEAMVSHIGIGDKLRVDI